ncbi:hypothetical protein TVAG_253810 [Trichomonas vaginalis G3]|uniref:Uncharacterized protein n=1 Tax=Trichomonas vaginalis (strain ATCC PRA-98 / G3) TaxID=412133 RepID=A2DMP8_TRIV3|nr:associate of C-MYC AMY-1 family [Trichomonas vaginalis G3]EAY18269.1 hypothetical protein TVAG_253810 [Trichomonas vaginalis G3]KAI5541910.1 associate of C-MYC AMY-1 family [Trichomonas vaginalis G3]|eukprot:XP_001579255.1 hypothetical protein [Trichomonas vaginalis G3]
MSDDKAEFRNYLEQSGVVDSINKVLINLFDEVDLPNDPMEYIKQYLGCPKGVDAAAIAAENARLEEEIKNLEEQLKKKK